MTKFHGVLPLLRNVVRYGPIIFGTRHTKTTRGVWFHDTAKYGYFQPGTQKKKKICPNFTEDFRL
ncbi:MAG TPA: hypothetical protein H9691_01115, partial [Firmicutes bacterium]|nr:hypothetical protein [Bacillota bacterium]